MDPTRLVHLVSHLESQSRPATTALRLVADGTLEAWELPGRNGWWVDPAQLETALTEHGPRVEAEAAARRRPA